MFKRLTHAAQSLKERAEVGKKIEATRQFAEAKYESGKVGAAAAWEQHWPAVEHLIVEGLLTVAEEKLKDDQTLKGLFLKLYKTLPVAARIVLSRERFVEFTMARRDGILIKLQDLRAKREAERETQA